MRFNDQIICNSMPLMHNESQNNNQLQKTSSELVINEKETNLTTDQDSNQKYQIEQETSILSSIAQNRNNKNIEHNINNNLDNTYKNSSCEDLTDFEGYYDEDSPEEDDEEKEEEEEDVDEDDEASSTDWSEFSDYGHLPQGCRGIVNPNYPGFQHLEPSLLSDTDDTDDERDVDEIAEDEYNNNGKVDTQGNLLDEEVNRLDVSSGARKKQNYEKTTFNIHQSVSSLIECMNKAENVAKCNNIFEEDVQVVQLSTSVKETLQFAQIEEIIDSSKNSEAEEFEETVLEEPMDLIRETNNKESPLADLTELTITKIPESTPIKIKEIDLLAGLNRESIYQKSVPDVVSMEIDSTSDMDKDDNKLNDIIQMEEMKKEKMIRNQAKRRQQKQQIKYDNKKIVDDNFDVYKIETALPKIDMDVIESHLKAAHEAELQRRTSREEIRRRLAMGTDTDEARSAQGRKPSLQSRLLNGMNLQICFMNENSSDTESVAGLDIGPTESPTRSPSRNNTNTVSSVSSTSNSNINNSPVKQQRPQLLELPPLRPVAPDEFAQPLDEVDFFARQARLQMEARLALAQAKEMAHLHMQLERQKMKQLPITGMVKASLKKIGVTLGEDRRRLTRTLLTDLNIEQLQVLANDLHTRIATLNEDLVEGLMLRDELLMEQDSMLVDVEDLTRYLYTSVCRGANNNQQEINDRNKTKKQKQNNQQQPKLKPKNRLISIGKPGLAVGRQLVANLVRK